MGSLSPVNNFQVKAYFLLNDISLAIILIARYCFSSTLHRPVRCTNLSYKNTIKEKIMPVITITMGTGQADAEQKKTIIKDFTTRAVEIMKLPPQSFTILINELNHDAIGVGGMTLKEKYAAQ